MQSLIRCRKFEVFRHAWPGPDGRDHTKEFVVHPGAVVVLPLSDAQTCLLIRQVRHVVDQVLWELPAGTLDIPGEDPREAALRELEEETGHRAERIDPLCKFYTSPGVMTELIHAYVASGLTATTQQLGPSEEITVVPTPLEEAFGMIDRGEIVDAKTIITLLSWRRRQEGAR